MPTAPSTFISRDKSKPYYGREVEVTSSGKVQEVRMSVSITNTAARSWTSKDPKSPYYGQEVYINERGKITPKTQTVLMSQDLAAKTQGSTFYATPTGLQGEQSKSGGKGGSLLLNTPSNMSMNVPANQQITTFRDKSGQIIGIHDPITQRSMGASGGYYDQAELAAFESSRSYTSNYLATHPIPDKSVVTLSERTPAGLNINGVDYTSVFGASAPLVYALFPGKKITYQQSIKTNINPFGSDLKLSIGRSKDDQAGFNAMLKVQSGQAGYGFIETGLLKVAEVGGSLFPGGKQKVLQFEAAGVKADELIMSRAAQASTDIKKKYFAYQQAEKDKGFFGSFPAYDTFLRAETSNINAAFFRGAAHLAIKSPVTTAATAAGFEILGGLAPAAWTASEIGLSPIAGIFTTGLVASSISGASQIGGVSESIGQTGGQVAVFMGAATAYKSLPAKVAGYNYELTTLDVSKVKAGTKLTGFQKEGKELPVKMQTEAFGLSWEWDLPAKGGLRNVGAKQLIGLSRTETGWTYDVGQFPKLTPRTYVGGIIQGQEYKWTNQPRTITEGELWVKNLDRIFTKPSTTLIEGQTVSPEFQQVLGRVGYRFEQAYKRIGTETPGNKLGFDIEVLKAGTKQLSPKAAKQVLGEISNLKGILTGSGADMGYVRNIFRRLPGDYDVHFLSGVQEYLSQDYAIKQMDFRVSQLMKAAKRGGETVRMGAEGSYSFETLKQGKFGKAAELKSELLAPEGSQAQPTFGGMDLRPEVNPNLVKFNGKTLTISNIMGGGQRKLAGFTMNTEPGAMGVAHAGRFKDLPDWFRISASRGQASLRTGQGSMAEVVGIRNTYMKAKELGVDITATEGSGVPVASKSSSFVSTGFGKPIWTVQDYYNRRGTGSRSVASPNLALYGSPSVSIKRDMSPSIKVSSSPSKASSRSVSASSRYGSLSGSVSYYSSISPSISVSPVISPSISPSISVSPSMSPSDNIAFFHFVTSPLVLYSSLSPVTLHWASCP